MCFITELILKVKIKWIKLTRRKLKFTKNLDIIKTINAKLSFFLKKVHLLIHKILQKN